MRERRPGAEGEDAATLGAGGEMAVSVDGPMRPPLAGFGT